MKHSNEKTEQLEQWISESDQIVFFGGAGVSTESGIPDFRGPDGLYEKTDRVKAQWPVETILSRTFFDAHPDVFYEYYRQNFLFPQAKPNAAHIRLAQLEQEGKLIAVITQNIDGLHQAAGSKHVLELHGSVNRNVCLLCGRKYDLNEIHYRDRIPVCLCGGRIKPDIVLYGEELDQRVIRLSIQTIARADLLIIGGTSLSVYPAAGLIEFMTTCRMVIVNQSETPFDHRADLVIHAPIGRVLARSCRSDDGSKDDVSR